ncbi:hypothetical protein BJV78DRAFT_1156168 [Lactifluus subvellereus]|nr:hypothetical protein BJV78DRAFT_1156168 [Lactifluus subvellereus]
MYGLLNYHLITWDNINVQVVLRNKMTEIQRRWPRLKRRKGVEEVVVTERFMSYCIKINEGCMKVFECFSPLSWLDSGHKAITGTAITFAQLEFWSPSCDVSDRALVSIPATPSAYLAQKSKVVARGQVAVKSGGVTTRNASSSLAGRVEDARGDGPRFFFRARHSATSGRVNSVESARWKAAVARV